MPEPRPGGDRPGVRHRRRGPGRFVTTLILQDLARARTIWHSRRNRKGLDPEPRHMLGRTRPRRYLFLAPTRVAWWIGVLFMVGAALFAVGSIGPLFEPGIAATSAWILFVGSLFFTSAAYLQVFEVIHEPSAETGQRPRVALLRWEPHKVGWWAVIVQFIGTLLFNMNTLAGTQPMRPAMQEALVWAPNALGSVCFLAASYLAYAEVCRRWFAWQPANVSWWVVLINLWGSIAFGVSAVASVVLIPSGRLLSAGQADINTFVGAICFFVGAYLLLPEMTACAAPPPADYSKRMSSR